MNWKKILTFLTIIFITVGILLLIYGIRNIYNTNLISENYIELNATFKDTTLYERSESGNLYTLNYSYMVNGLQYQISTDYATSIIPKIGSEKLIKYNPSNPSEAIFVGGSNTLVIILGFLFTIIPIMINLGKKSMLGQLSPTLQKIFYISIGLIFIIFGLTFYWILCMGSDSLSIINAFQTFGFITIIPILFMIFGIINTLYLIFNKK